MTTKLSHGGGYGYAPAAGSARAEVRNVWRQVMGGTIVKLYLPRSQDGIVGALERAGWDGTEVRIVVPNNKMTNLQAVGAHV